MPLVKSRCPYRRGFRTLPKIVAYLSILLLAVATSRADAQRASSAAKPTARATAEWRLAWHDEFTSASIDTTHWTFDLGNGFAADSGKTFVAGWGNSELQCYTRDSNNVFLRDGALHIRAAVSPSVSKSTDPCYYTSARLKTRALDGQALVAPRYGRIEFRAKLPTGQGVWPALWMLPLGDAYGTWAASGEIDIMEARGQTPTTVLGTLHYGARWPANTYTGKDYTLPRNGQISDFHLYAIEWTPGRISWSVDGVSYQTQTFWWSTSAASPDGRQGAKPTNASQINTWPAPFDQPFYLIMNVAVGGNFLGNPDATTRFPAEMIVDYVRVYEKTGGYGAMARRGAGAIPYRAP